MNSKAQLSSKQIYPLNRYIPPHPFDYCFLMWTLRALKRPRDKITAMIQKHEIIHIKKGLYILSPEHGGKIDRNLIANLIYGHSYVSSDFALHYWGLIPERVEEVTSMTTKRNKMYQTPMGVFSYKYLPVSKFYPGILLERLTIPFFTEDKVCETGCYIASREKALCDKVAAFKEIRKPEDVGDFLFTNLRIDMERLSGLDCSLLDDIEKAYGSVPVTAFVRWYKGSIGA